MRCTKNMYEMQCMSHAAFVSTLVIGGWETLASKPNPGNRATSALFSNSMYAGTPTFPVNTIYIVR